MESLIWVVAALLLLLRNTSANMNGKPGQYKIANGNPRSENAFSTEYKAEFFDVYSPVIKTRYSEVYWRMQEAVPIPDSIKERFENKIMAVVGYEVDQVQRNGKLEQPVPITWAYNHHYGAWLLNAKKSKLVKVKASKEAVRLGLNHGSDEHWTQQLLHENDQSKSVIPLMQFFSEGNGGEFRMSHHGYPKGYAQLIESPDTFQVIPMQIDTWNREMTSTKFMPGPLPKSSRIPSSAGYSGLLECPCSDRLEKKWAMTYALQSSGSCTEAIQNASDCFSGAREVVQAARFMNNVISDSSKPSGCSVEQHSDGSTDIVWNSAEGSAAGEFSASDSRTRFSAYSQAQVNLTVNLDKVDSDDAVSITIVGPADRWFGVGFGSATMCVHMVSDECPDGGPYAIIVSGDGQGGVTERKLDFHGPGTALASSVTVKSSTVHDGNRTVVLTRSLKGASDKHYAFDPSIATVPIITARGCSLDFAQHCGHGPSELNFLATDAPTFICRAGNEGSIGGNMFDNKRCDPFPKSDLVAQGNPTCSVETYRGGLSCCRHGQSLLDKDQEVPWSDRYLEYQLKFRFYFEEYDVAASDTGAPSHQSLVRLYWQTESHAGEYDIAQCPDGVSPSQCVQVITSRWSVRDMMSDCSIRADASWCTGEGSADGNRTEGIKLIYAGPHCHAPTCLSMDLYNADTGQLLCHVEPIHGGSDDLYDERGFLAIPPCLWGDESEGLVEPELLSLDATLMSVKRNNNTLGHTGEMASWQMRGIIVPKQRQPQEQQAEAFSGPHRPAAESDLESVDSPVKRRGQLRNGGV